MLSMDLLIAEPDHGMESRCNSIGDPYVQISQFLAGPAKQIRRGQGDSGYFLGDDFSRMLAFSV